MFNYNRHISKYVSTVYFTSLAFLLFYMMSNLLLVSLNKSFAEEEKAKDYQQKLPVRSLTNKKKLFTKTKNTTVRKRKYNSPHIEVAGGSEELNPKI